MTDTTTQTAVDATQAAASPAAAAGQDAQQDGDDLDKLLSEYETGTQQTPAAAASPQPGQTAGADDLKALTEQVKGLLTENQNAKFRRDMDATLKNIRGELDSEFFDDAFVESWIDAQARKDPRLSTAWNERDGNPRQFQKVVGQLSRDFAKKYGKLPDKAATEDREAVTAAVRGASTKVPEGQPPNYASMTDAELAREKDKLFGR